MNSEKDQKKEVWEIPLSEMEAQWGTDKDPDIHVVLYQPEIPPNTGNIARLCAATGAVLHLIEPLGFALDHRKLKRAGLDYWPSVRLCVHPNLEHMEAIFPHPKWHLISTKGVQHYDRIRARPGMVLLFGRETRGVPQELHDRYASQRYCIPINARAVRSLNLSNAVSIVLYEMLRQLNFAQIS